MGYYLEDHPNLTLPQFGWPRNRVSGVIGVHTTESGVVPAGADPGAENTAGFISRRDTYGSYHSLADYDSRIKLVRPRYAAWADTTNNAHAMSVSGAMNAARWRDLTPERAAGIVRNMGIAAAELVQDAIADGLLASPPPARRITATEAITGSKAGFYGHGETNPGTRYDPGTNFDWDLFLASYAAAISGVELSTTITDEDDDMLVIARDSAAADPNATWIGNGMHRRHIPDPPTLAAMQVLARDGALNIFQDGQVQNLPTASLGSNLDESVTLALLNANLKRQGAGAGIGPTTNLAAVLGWFDANVISLLDAIKATSTTGGATVEQITAALKDTLAKGIEIDVDVTAKAK